MNSTKSLRVLLGSVSAAVLLIGAAGSASAQTQIRGGGASLPANSIRDVMNCYTTNPVDFSPPEHASAGCVTGNIQNRLVGYASVGSGAGRRSFVQRDSNQLGLVSTGGFSLPFANNLQTLSPAQPKLRYDNTAPGFGYGEHHYSLSEEPLSQTTSSNNDSLDCYEGISCPTDQRIIAGNALQTPFIATTVNIAFNIPGRTAQIRLTRDAYCGIFNGTVTDWNDPLIKAGNNGNSVVPGNPNGPQPIEAVFMRADGSGTSFLISNHLSNNCTGFPAGFTGSTSPTQWPNFLYRISNNNGVANAIAKTPYSVGYITPELSAPFAAIVSLTADATASQQAPLTGTINVPAGDAPAPLVARLENPVSGNFIVPTPGSAALSLSSLVPPTGTDAAEPVNWRNAGILATTTNPSGYPIAGFNWFMNYTCYANAGVSGGVRGFWSFVLNNPTFDEYRDIVGLRGLSAMPSNWRIQQRITLLVDDNTEISPSQPGARNVNCDTNTFPGRTGA